MPVPLYPVAGIVSMDRLGHYLSRLYRRMLLRKPVENSCLDRKESACTEQKELNTSVYVACFFSENMLK